MPTLVDRPALMKRRARAASAPELFLHERFLSEVEERLEEVNRSFTAVAIITPWPDLWRSAFPDATIVADTDTLALSEAAHDLVIHALCLHWSNDPLGQLIQCRTALKPDGFLIASLFGGETLRELRAEMMQAEIDVLGGVTPHVLPMGEIRDLGALLQRAGYALPVADMDAFDVHYETALHLMRDLRAMGETNALFGRVRHFTPRAAMLAAIQYYSANHADNGRIPAHFEIVTLTGWAPDANQPQPLKPGSASHRLSDILAQIKAED